MPRFLILSPVSAEEDADGRARVASGRCPKGHRLTLCPGRPADEWICDACDITGGLGFGPKAPKQRRNVLAADCFRCDTCDYDICASCRASQAQPRKVPRKCVGVGSRYLPSGVKFNESLRMSPSRIAEAVIDRCLAPGDSTDQLGGSSKSSSGKSSACKSVAGRSGGSDSVGSSIGNACVVSRTKKRRRFKIVLHHAIGGWPLAPGTKEFSEVLHLIGQRCPSLRFHERVLLDC